MKTINQTVILRGYVAKEVKVYSTYKEKGRIANVGNLTLAIQNGTDNADFIPITLFGKICDLLEQYTTKGTQLLLSCMIKNNVYTKEIDGEKVYKGGIQVQCEEFQILGQPPVEKSK